ncbi:hypothetical protein [Ancylomarina longa]|uniref:Uncharacterized protein n=1 Tax=Ancylomarina longa TaxID=2487017 RepID=A0A434AUW9_9BACT|nr:hypothetical protein [Ancylomarina longa]RUT78260.1 hypothetical protein DLK05_09290 [Ancylomarina longa]
MKFTFTQKDIEKSINEYSDNENFDITILPRIMALYAIKKELKEIQNLRWYYEYDHVNIHQNQVVMEYENNQSNNFTFHYQIPLKQNFELNVFLANSSIHFLDIYNFLIQKNIIQKDQFPLKAEYHTIPHFTISMLTKRYNLRILKKITEEKDLNHTFTDDAILNELKNGFNIFNPIFEQILNQFKI